MKALKMFLFLLLSLSATQCASPRPTLLPSTDEQVDLSRWNRTDDCCSAQGSQIAISSGGTHSSRAGLEMIAAGGNAIDAAVAVAFSLCVERPQSTGIGGGGFALLHLAGEKEERFLDFRETAPAKATKNMFLDESGQPLPGTPSQDSIFAVATPGFVSGMWELHKKWGKLPWKQVLAPAVRLAKEGFAIYPTLAAKIEASKKQLGNLSHTRSIFYEGKRPKGIGDKLVQTDLGQSIALIADSGPDAFYKGEIASRILSTMKQYGGIMTAQDLESYKPVWRDPIRFAWRGYEVVTAPPPSAGGIILAETFKVWDGLQSSVGVPTEDQHIHWLAESFRRGFAFRSEAIGDPSVVKVPVSEMISDRFTDDIRKAISDRATKSTSIRPGVAGRAKRGTTGFTIIDREGNAISSTITINTRFGSHILVPQSGIFLNNEMDDFSIKPGQKNAFGLTGGENNSIAPGKRPVSSMTPTVVLKSNKPVLAVSGAGGSRIITAVVQTALNYLAVFPGDLRRSVFSPRMHHQWLPDRLDLEAGISEATRENLRKRGHQISEPDWDPIITAVGVEGGVLTAIADPREEGGAATK